MKNQFICAEITGGYNHRFVRCFFVDIANGGVGYYLNGSATASSNDTAFINCFAKGGLAGFRLSNTDATWMSDCDSILNTYGLLTDPGANQRVLYCFFTACAWDSSGYTNAQIAPSSNGYVRALTFVGCWTATFQAGATGGCMQIAGNVDGVQIIGHRFFNNPVGNGLWVSAAKNVFVDACVASAITAGTGYTFVAGTSNFALRNCHAGTYAGLPGNKMGAYVGAGSTRYLVSNCTFIGNTTSGFTDLGTPPNAFGPNLTA